MSIILKRLLYCGKVIVPAHDKEPVKIVQGIHEPLVSEQLFYQVQQLLGDNKKARGKFIPKYSKLRDDFHLRGILNCHSCGKTMTASFSKGKLGKQYGYYHCNHCKSQRVPSSKIHQSMYSLLKSITYKPEIKMLYNLILEQLLGSNEAENKKKIKDIQLQLDQLNNRIEKMQDLMLDGKLDAEEYASIKTRYSVQIDELTKR